MKRIWRVVRAWAGVPVVQPTPWDDSDRYSFNWWVRHTDELVLFWEVEHGVKLQFKNPKLPLTNWDTKERLVPPYLGLD